ncbi:MAG: acetate/propionate family kinase [Pirellulales bacterium]|jgi:acetate kinase|nr:acetate/propionate family kinase [Pirellulales bacterium]MDO7688887.1 acetate/propionate family kinase [Pirellulales bacterium]
MKILIANLGSTSFKYRLFEVSAQSDAVGDEQELARGGVERIGGQESRVYASLEGAGAAATEVETIQPVPDHGVALEAAIAQLTAEEGPLSSIADVAAIGFKAVHGGRVSGVVRVDDSVLEAMEEMADVAPAHNPPYVKAMKQLAERFPDVPLVAAFETDFHSTIPDRNARYAVPTEWVEKHLVRRWGFHGASHRFVAGRLLENMDQRPLRAVQCHLGGSSSICWTRDGQSVGTSMGMSPQSGLPQNNRSGDVDPYALLHVSKTTGRSLEDLLVELSTRAGLAGMSGTSGDMRDLEAAAANGNEAARVAIDVYISSIRHWLGGGMVELGGLDAIAFTGGIGENSPATRAAVVAGLTDLGIEIDSTANKSGATGERRIEAARSPVAIWIIPTNEEVIVARQTRNLLALAS